MIKDPKYGIPQLKKFPLPDARHVKSAIKFFNYVPPRYEKQLAAAILRRMREYGMSFEDFTVGDENRFSKYIPKSQLETAMAHSFNPRITGITSGGGFIYSDELYHHGILGQKWGKKNGPPYPLGAGDHSAAEKKAGWQDSLSGHGDSEAVNSIKSSGHYTRNIDSFGKDQNHNILYVTGLSGSGKSTVVNKFKNSNKIHLDFYFEQGDPEETKKYQDAEFNDFMHKKGIEFEKITELPHSDKEKWKIVDELGEALTDFSKEQYKKGKSVVCEGVQIADQTLHPDKSFFKDKSMVVLETSSMKSLKRSMERDGISPFDVACVAQRVKNNKAWKQSIKDLKASLDGKSDRDAIIQIKKSLSDKDKKQLNMGKNDYSTSFTNAFVEYDGKKPVSYFTIDKQKDGSADVSVAVSSGARSKGYGSKVVNKAMDHINSHLDEYTNVYWATKPDNKASQRLAENAGFKLVRDDNKWKTYVLKGSKRN